MGLIQGIHVYDLHFYILSLEVIPNEQHCSDLLEHDRQYPAMAEAIAKGAREAGAQVDVFSVDQVGVDQVLEYDQLALGCPAMGAEVLEESEFEPFFSQLEGRLSGSLWPSSAPTAGATASGCVTGYSVPTTQTLSSTPMRASSSTKPRTTTASQSARSSARASQHSKQSRNSLNALHITCAKRNFDRICKANP